MSHRTRRALLVVSILLSFALPLAAQARPDRPENPAERFLAAVWEHLTASFTALRAAAIPDTDAQPAAPPTSEPGSATDGRSTIDPLG